MRFTSKVYKYITPILALAMFYNNAYADCTAPADDTERIICNVIEFFSIGKFLTVLYDNLFIVGIAIGLLSIVAAGYKVMTSHGTPEKVKEGSEDLTAAVTGVLFIILSLVILRVIIGSLLDGNFTS